MPLLLVTEVRCPALASAAVCMAAAACWALIGSEYDGSLFDKDAFCRHHEEYLDICRCLRAVYETPSIAADEAQRTTTLKQICWCGLSHRASESDPLPSGLGIDTAGQWWCMPRCRQSCVWC